jgi:hypothetical protein
MIRREFTKAVYAQIVKRALHPKHGICCEGCGLVLGAKPYHVDHTVPDALQVDKSGKLTAEDGKLLGVDCCHKPKTVIDQGVIAKAKRVEESYLGMRSPAKKLRGPAFPKVARPEKTSTKIMPGYRALFAPSDQQKGQ